MYIAGAALVSLTAIFISSYDAPPQQIAVMETMAAWKHKQIERENFSWEEITLHVWSSWHLLLMTDELLESKLQKHSYPSCWYILHANKVFQISFWYI